MSRHNDDDEHDGAVVHSDGTRMWYRNSSLHRDDDKPAIIYAS